MIHLSYTAFSYKRYSIGSALILIGLFFFGYSIALTPTSTPKKTLWIVDISLSMGVEDIVESGSILHSRLDLAKAIIDGGIRQRWWEHAIIGYARSAWVLAPFSSDRAFLTSVVSGIQPIDIYGWSDISAAFLLVRSLYGGLGTPIEMILLSDGGSSTSIDTITDLPERSSLTIIGIGTQKWGKIPLGYDLDGERRYKYFEKKEITIPYEQDILKTLIKRYGASYIRKDYWDISSIGSDFFITIDPSIYRMFGIAFLLIGYIFHPYATSKK